MKKIDVENLSLKMLHFNASPFFLQITFSIQVEDKVYGYLFHANREKQTNISMYVCHLNEKCPFCKEGIHEDCKGFETVLSELYEKLKNDPKIRLQLLFR